MMLGSMYVYAFLKLHGVSFRLALDAQLWLVLRSGKGSFSFLSS